MVRSDGKKRSVVSSECIFVFENFIINNYMSREYHKSVFQYIFRYLLPVQTSNPSTDRHRLTNAQLATL